MYSKEAHLNHGLNAAIKKKIRVQRTEKSSKKCPKWIYCSKLQILTVFGQFKKKSIFYYRQPEKLDQQIFVYTCLYKGRANVGGPPIGTPQREEAWKMTPNLIKDASIYLFMSIFINMLAFKLLFVWNHKFKPSFVLCFPSPDKPNQETYKTAACILRILH